MARERSFMDRITRSLDLLEEPIPGVPIVELAGEKRVLIENHQGVTQYGPDSIRVKVKFGAVCVNGCGLELARMTKGQLVISGRIESIELVRGCR